MKLVALVGIVLLGLAAPPPAARAEEGGVTVLDERFDAPRVVPVLPTYDRITPALADRIEAGGRWHLVLNGSRTVASAEIAGGEAVLRLVEVGREWYAVQLAYVPLRLRPSREYRVTVRVRADRPVRTTFDVCTVSRTWYSFAGKKALEIGAGWQELEVRFRTAGNESDSSARLELNFGGVEPNVVRVDGVRVVEGAAEGAGG